MFSDATINNAVFKDRFFQERCIGSVCKCGCVVGGAFFAYRSGVLCVPGRGPASVHGLINRPLSVVALH